MPDNVAPSVVLLAAPLILFVLILASDLAYRATIPTDDPVRNVPRRIPAHDVQFLTQQVEVGASSSTSYFESVVLSRVRDVLDEKVSLETGLDKKRVKEILRGGREGIKLLKDEKLYGLLNAPPPPRGKARLKLLKETIQRIEAWKA